MDGWTVGIMMESPDGGKDVVVVSGMIRIPGISACRTCM
jgi:hypothetical protein